MVSKLETTRWGWLVLFATATTLFCCALPIILVSLGLGSLWAALYANIAPIGFVAENKQWFFGGSAALLLLSAYALYRPDRSCPTDHMLTAKCRSAELWNKRLLIAASLVWLVGAAAAYLALPLSQLLPG